MPKVNERDQALSRAECRLTIYLLEEFEKEADITQHELALMLISIAHNLLRREKNSKV